MGIDGSFARISDDELHMLQATTESEGLILTLWNILDSSLDQKTFHLYNAYRELFNMLHSIGMEMNITSFLLPNRKINDIHFVFDKIYYYNPVEVLSLAQNLSLIKFNNIKQWFVMENREDRSDSNLDVQAAHRTAYLQSLQSFFRNAADSSEHVIFYIE